MKTGILASIIIGGVLATSIAQADSASSTRDLDVRYYWTPGVDVSYYWSKTPAILAAAVKPTCNLHTVKSDSSPADNSTESDYLAARNFQVARDLKLAC
jgi:hypothetical protein